MSGLKEAQVGKVYLVGAGSGDIELLTLKALRVVESADVILYDRLVNPLFLYLAKQSATFVYCGKLPQSHSLTQEEIEEQLVHYAQAGKLVIRLKGGDPAIFGRVGEEMASLEAHGIPFEVIPGVTAASVASIYAGIPLTHRGVSSHVTLATGHRQAGCNDSVPDFSSLLQGGTLALYMGVENLARISHRLISGGVPATTAVAVIAWGSYGRQRVVTSQLATIADVLQKEAIENPALIVIGQVVACRQEPSWFEQLPDYGRRLLLVSQQAIDWQTLVGYTSQGADVWAITVGSARDGRFSDLHQRYLKEQDWQEVIYLDDDNQTADLLEKEWLDLGLELADLQRISQH